MLTRIISAIIGLVLFFAIMFSESFVLSIAVALLSIIALYEVFGAYGYKKNKIFFIAGIACSIVFAFINFITIKVVFAVFFAMFALFVVIMLLNHDEISSKDIFTALFLNFLIPFVFSSICLIKRMDNGEIYVWLPFIAAWVTDTFAYFSGRFFGKHKLIEKISPKKTLEGSIGGTLGAVAGFLIFALCIGKYNNITFNIPSLIILALSSSIFSQIGDLLASSIKRENGVKDFGNIMPGHGGVLDRFDSFLITVPYIFIYLILFPII